METNGTNPVSSASGEQPKYKFDLHVKGGNLVIVRENGKEMMIGSVADPDNRSLAAWLTTSPEYYGAAIKMKQHVQLSQKHINGVQDLDQAIQRRIALGNKLRMYDTWEGKCDFCESDSDEIMEAELVMKKYVSGSDKLVPTKSKDNICPRCLQDTWEANVQSDTHDTVINFKRSLENFGPIRPKLSGA